MTKIQFITAENNRYSHLDGARMALEGGCRWIQLRMKDSTTAERMETAKKMKVLCREYGATFIIDDDVETALKVAADGVHLGKNDMPIGEARNILGSGLIIGGTANTFSDVERIWLSGGDYVGCGPFRFTTTKKNLSPILGIEGYRTIVAQMRERKIAVPMVAIGGITIGDIPAITATGIDQIALSGTVLNAKDPVGEMRRIIDLSLKEK